MGTVEDRKIGAIVGALVADAASQPVHWNYKTEQFDEFLKDKDEVAFIKPSHNPFYCIETGKFSCYGDQSTTILKSLVENGGVNTEHLKKAIYETFGPESEYENQDNAVYKDKSEVKKTIYPIKTPWRHFSIKSFLKMFEAGEETTGTEDNQMDCVLNMVSVVALYAGCPEMLDKVEEVITLTQNSDINLMVVCAAARLLEYYILHGKSPSSEAIENVLKQMEDPKRNNPQSLDRAMITHIREVIANQKMDHVSAARKFNIS